MRRQMIVSFFLLTGLALTASACERTTSPSEPSAPSLETMPGGCGSGSCHP
jgi:hypothetical protein